MPHYMDDEDDPEKQKLLETCRNGSFNDIVKAVGGNVKEYHKNGMMAHHLVAQSGRPDMQDMLEELIHAGCDVNAVTRGGGDTILHLIISSVPIKNAFPAVLRIMDFDPDLDIRNRNLRTPYDVAMAQGYFDLANAIDGTKTPEQAKDYYTNEMGSTYGKKLIEAVLNDKEADAIESIYSGADCNLLNEHGCGAIHYAMSSYSHPPLKLLTAMMESNADVNLRDYEGDTVLNLTIKKDSIRDSGEMYKIVEKLMEWGADPSCNDLDGNDAIALATKKNYLDIMKLLKTRRKAIITTPRPTITPGSINNTPREPKPTPREPTVKKKVDFEPKKPEPKKTEPIKIPSDDDQKEEEPNRTESTPVKSESEVEPNQPESEVTEDMDDSIPNYDDSDMDHPPPNDLPNEEESIVTSVELGDDDELGRLLDDPDADLNVPNEAGLYPIHIAVMRESPTQRNQLVERLLVNGADINVRAVEHESHEETGNTALHMAVARDQVGTVKLLLGHTPAYSVPNQEGLIPRDIAESNGNVEIMQLLEDYKRIVDKSKKSNKSGTCSIL